MQKYICIVDSFSGLSRILSELSCFGKKVFALNREVLGSRKNVLPEFIQVVGTEVVYFSHFSLNPEISQFIVLKLIWPSSGTFQHHHQLTSSADTSSPTFLCGRNFEHASLIKGSSNVR